MGIVATNYVIEDEIIKKSVDSDFDFEKYMSDKINCPNCESWHYQKLNLCYGALLKAWCPMYELLILLDKSENHILKELQSYERHISESNNRSRFRYYFSNEVNDVWLELKKISVGLIEASIDNPTIVETIYNIEGYWNDRIVRKQHIVAEFIELYNAFYSANWQNKGLIITYS